MAGSIYTQLKSARSKGLVSLKWCNKRMEWFIIALLFALGLFFRLPTIETHPPGLWYDEAINGLDALSLHANPFQIFFTTEEHPREPMFMYIIAMVFLLVKPTIFTLRGVSVLIGAACVPALYGLVRIATQNKRFALIAALLLLTSRWHIHHSRLALRGILVPLWLCLSFVAYFYALKKRRIIYYIIAGIIFGLGFYTHIAFRLAPVILIFPLIWLIRKNVLTWRGDKDKIAAFIGAAILIFFPLGIDYIKHPFHFSGRIDQISPFSQGVGTGILLILKNIWSSLLMFNFRGDKNPLLNMPGMPVFNPLASVFFFWGIYYCLRRARRDLLAFFLFPWLGIMLLNTILSTEAPHFGRSLGAFVPAVIITAAGLSQCLEWLEDFLRRRRAIIIFSALLLIIAGWDLYLYYGLYKGDARLWYRSNAAWTDVAKTIKNYELRITNAKLQQVYFYLPRDIYYHPSVRFITLDVSRDVIRPMAFPEALTGRKGDPPRNHLLLATYLNSLYPILEKEIANGRINTEIRTPERQTWALFYLIPKEALLNENQAKTLLTRYAFETNK